ncbi:hypothetical protein ACSBR1_015830 [Camellia fascicularis]
MVQMAENKWESLEKLNKDFTERSWSEFKKTYYKPDESDLGGTKINGRRETPLHIAVYENIDAVKNKLEEMKPKELRSDLADDRGNTPLHLAAQLGNSIKCMLIASKMGHLIYARNKYGETPIFTAARYGMQDAFMILCIIDNLMQHHEEIAWGRSNDGSSVLHCAIYGQYFELAYQIIVRFPEFVHCLDEKGYTPLHVLATNYTAFRSGSQLNWLQNLIYYCIPVEKPHVALTLPIISTTGERDDHDKVTDVENPLPRRPSCPPWINIIAGVFKRLHVFQRAQYGLLMRKYLFPEHMVEMKEKHTWAIAIKDILLSPEAYNDHKLDDGRKPYYSDWDFDRPEVGYPDDLPQDPESSNQKKGATKETPLLLAAKNGIIEIVSAILEKFSTARHQVNSGGKNVVHMAVENRQSHVYELLRKKKSTSDLFNHVDDQGNNALHLVAMSSSNESWIAPNVVLQMQWETMWYEYIKSCVPTHMVLQQNNEGKTPNEIFLETNSKILKYDKEWLRETAEQCSLVATLIATVAFATSTSVPGDFDKGKPVLVANGMFKLFAIPSIFALCSSLTAAAIFLSILTSRLQVSDFRWYMPLMLVFGLTALFTAITSMLITFGSGHYFLINNIVRHATLIEFVGAFLLPVTCFVLVLFPLYRNVSSSLLRKIPQRGYLVAA